MPIKRPQLVNSEIYHIVIRAIEGLELFRNKKDYLRMIHNLFKFNDENPALSTYRHSFDKPRVTLGLLKRKMLIEILAFCLMPNHIHLLVRQIQDQGISKFMLKIGAGYGLYYNKKYERKGHVFQGPYRIIHIKNQEQLKTIFVYIHCNPVSLIVPNWKEKGIRSQNLKNAIKFLENYQWSSYSDYLEKENFPFLAERKFLKEVMGGIEGCQKFVNEWLEFKKELANFGKIAIE